MELGQRGAATGWELITMNMKKILVTLVWVLIGPHTNGGPLLSNIVTAQGDHKFVSRLKEDDLISSQAWDGSNQTLPLLPLEAKSIAQKSLKDHPIFKDWKFYKVSLVFNQEGNKCAYEVAYGLVNDEGLELAKMAVFITLEKRVIMPVARPREE